MVNPRATSSATALALGDRAALVSALGFATFTMAPRWRRLEGSLPPSVLGSLFAVTAGAIPAGLADQPLAAPVPDVLWCALMASSRSRAG